MTGAGVDPGEGGEGGFLVVENKRRNSNDTGIVPGGGEGFGIILIDLVGMAGPASFGDENRGIR